MDVPTDPAPQERQIRKLRKPARIMVRKTVPGPTANRQAPAGRSSAEDKKMQQLLVHKQKLEAKSEHLDGQLQKLRSEHNHTEQERDRLQQFWQLSRRQLDDERKATLELERNMDQMRSHQAEHVTKLHQKMRSLILASKTQRIASTQTEAHTGGGGYGDAQCQTTDQLSRQKAEQLLRQSDTLLAAFVAELEKEKLTAQSDLKYAVVQLEQRMKEETDFQLRRLREESQRQLDEISQQHADQIRALESDQLIEREQCEGRIEYLQSELLSVRETNDSLSRSLDEARVKVAEQARNLARAETQSDDCRKEMAKLVEYKKRFQRDIRNVDAMKREVAKYKDINEIVMGEFTKLEKERDELLVELDKGIRRMDRANGARFENIGLKVSQLEAGIVGKAPADY